MQKAARGAARPPGVCVLSAAAAAHTTADLLFCKACLPPSPPLGLGVCGSLIFWEHPVCVHRLFSLKASDHSGLLINATGPKQRPGQKKNHPEDGGGAESSQEGAKAEGVMERERWVGRRGKGKRH